MALHDHPLEPAHPLGDGRIILPRNCAPVEEASAIIELELPRFGQPGERVIDLRGNCAKRHGLLNRVAPEIAHQAAPGTFAVGQENGRHAHYLTRFSPLFLSQERIGLEWIKLVPSGATRPNPGIPRGSRFWVGGGQWEE